MAKIKLTEEQREEIRKNYINDATSIQEIINKYDVSRPTAYRVFKNKPILSKKVARYVFSDIDKKEIIRLYVEEKRGASYICLLFNCSDATISKYLTLWGVPKWSKSELCKRNREVYGITEGFSGRTHSKKSKKKTSESVIKSFLNNPEKIRNRTSPCYKTKYYETLVGKVQGRYEVAYIQKLYEKGEELPELVLKRIRTPFGSYEPDFKFKDHFIEVKSDFTNDLGLGKHRNGIGSLVAVNQRKKIRWVNKNVMEVKYIILNQSEAMYYFRRALKDNGVLNNL